MTYDLKDLGSTSRRDQSLEQIFGIIDKAKEGTDVGKENQNAINQDVVLQGEALLKAIEDSGITICKKDDEEKRKVKITSADEAYFAL